MNRDPAAWARLGHLLKQARRAAALTQDQLAELAGVSTASVQAAEAGTVPKLRMPTTLGPIATALGWPVGSVEAVLEGATPPGWRDVPVQRLLDEEVLTGILTTAMVRAMESTPSAEIRAATRIALDELRRHGYLSKTNGVQPSADDQDT